MVQVQEAELGDSPTQVSGTAPIVGDGHFGYKSSREKAMNDEDLTSDRAAMMIWMLLGVVVVATAALLWMLK
jgi:hypothetical protein